MKGWVEVIENWGRLDLETVMQPAIRYAERGFPPSEYLRFALLSHKCDKVVLKTPPLLRCFYLFQCLSCFATNRL
ncbi:gamma-glutamyltransferase [Candidatus Poribacteria bacterium]|nr:gamma-glutamyltransferase [Candidatus Poribacteria bacterium]